ncbi:MAG: hypothetical protein WD688_04950 [Candidatus Binatia bacterium]
MILPKLAFALAMTTLLCACGSVRQAIQGQEISDLGRFEFRAPELAMKGVVMGAPHAGLALGSATLARAISDRTGAGYIAAYGFKSKRIAVAQPLVRTSPYPPIARNPAMRGSVFREFKKILLDISDGESDLYIEFRSRPADDAIERLQVVSSGFTFEELKIIQQSYLQIRDRLLGARASQRLSLAMSPFEKMTWKSSAIRHHGVLMVVNRGLSLRMPGKFLAGANARIYGDILTAWVTEIVRLVRRDTGGVPRIAVTLMDLGRFDSIPSSNGAGDVVVGAPHGSYDEYTAEIVRQVSHRTGFPAVIAKGFSPTQAGGWRINVNRPSEKTYLAPEFEHTTERSKEIYQTFKSLVLSAVDNDLSLYFDVHQYGNNRTIQVATVGVSSTQARGIKTSYQRIRERLLKGNPDIDTVELLIEPIDDVEIGAWPAKAHGILSVARKSLHFELPLHSLLRTQQSRDVYTQILAELFIETAHHLRR